MRDRFAAAGGILSYFTRHATAANLVMVMVVFAGLAVLPLMRAQYLPDIVAQTITVGVDWNGAGAEDVDRGIVQLLEPPLTTIEGVEEVSTVSWQGGSNIQLDFEPGWDMAQAMNDVQAAVDTVTGLPEETETPKITLRAWRDRVTDVVITGPVDQRQLIRLSDELLDRLFAAGVTRARTVGLTLPEMRVEVPMEALMRYRLTLSEIADRIAAEARSDPAGDIGGGAARLTTGREKRSPAQLAGIVLRSEPGGETLTLGEVARIGDGDNKGAHDYFVGSNPAVLLTVERSAEGDAIAIQHQVEEATAAMRPTLPEGVRIDLIRTRSADIIARLDILLWNGLQGLVLVVVMLFLFLNARTALWVAAGIPVAMLTAILAMWGFGLTFNMMSLFALIMTLGIVVDDAIVVGEHADFRARQLGEPPVAAAENAVRHMAAPVFSSTITTILAFLGLTAVSGRFGQMIADIPFTVAVVLAASLMEAFFILPHHMGRALSKSTPGAWIDAPSRVMNRGLGVVRDRLVRPLTRLVIRARYPVLAGALALLSYEASLFLKGEVPWRFFASPEEPMVIGNFTMVPGARRADTSEVLKAMEATVATVAADFETRYGGAPVTYVLAEVGANAWPRLPSAERRDPDLLGAVSVALTDPDLRTWSGAEFVAALQEAAPRHPLLDELSFRATRHGPGGGALDVQLSGADAETLKAAAEALKHALAPIPEISAVEDNMPYDKDEVTLELTPQGRALGFTADALGRELRARLSGITAVSVPEGRRTVDIEVALPDADLTADFLGRMLMQTASGGYVPLGDLVTVTRKSGFNQIRRENGIRVIEVTGDLAEDNPDRAAEILARVDREVLPRIAADYGVGYRLAGLNEQEADFLSDAFIGLMAALAGIYAVLCWIFSSWTRPIVVMAVIPLGLIGAIHGHAVWNIPLSMFSVVGMIGLSGIIINDAIVLISTVDEYAARRALVPAIVDAVADRLRAVMLTTVTTVLGLAPLMFETSRQAQFLQPTVITLCYGLGFGMVLVLLVVPALIVVQRDISGLVRSFRRALRPGPLRPLVAGAALVLAALFALLLGPALVAGSGFGPALLRFAGAAALCCLAAMVIGWARFKRGEARS